MRPCVTVSVPALTSVPLCAAQSCATVAPVAPPPPSGPFPIACQRLAAAPPSAAADRLAEAWPAERDTRTGALSAAGRGPGEIRVRRACPADAAAVRYWCNVLAATFAAAAAAAGRPAATRGTQRAAVHPLRGNDAQSSLDWSVSLRGNDARSCRT